MYFRTKYSGKGFDWEEKKKQASQEDNFVHNNFLPWFSLDHHTVMSHGTCNKSLMITKPRPPVSPGAGAKPRLGPGTLPTSGHQISTLLSPKHSYRHDGTTSFAFSPFVLLTAHCSTPSPHLATLPSCCPLYSLLQAHGRPGLRLPGTISCRAPWTIPHTHSSLPLSCPPTLHTSSSISHTGLLELIKCPNSSLNPRSLVPRMYRGRELTVTDRNGSLNADSLAVGGARTGFVFTTNVKPIWPAMRA